MILAQADDPNVDPDGFGWGHAVLFSPLPGDANLDGQVDINDLTIVLSNYGKIGATSVPGRLHRQRESGHQRPDHRVAPITVKPSAWRPSRPCPNRRASSSSGSVPSGCSATVADRGFRLRKGAGEPSRFPLLVAPHAFGAGDRRQHASHLLIFNPTAFAVCSLEASATAGLVAALSPS